MNSSSNDTRHDDWSAPQDNSKVREAVEEALKEGGIGLIIVVFLLILLLLLRRIVVARLLRGYDVERRRTGAGSSKRLSRPLA
jgi:hypothetical protein